MVVCVVNAKVAGSTPVLTKFIFFKIFGFLIFFWGGGLRGGGVHLLF